MSIDPNHLSDEHRKLLEEYRQEIPRLEVIKDRFHQNHQLDSLIIDNLLNLEEYPHQLEGGVGRRAELLAKKSQVEMLLKQAREARGGARGA